VERRNSGGNQRARRLFFFTSGAVQTGSCTYLSDSVYRGPRADKDPRILQFHYG